ncbi:MAG: hypothetical protein ACM3SS_02720 [Rhodospirillaceae bacterium]
MGIDVGTVLAPDDAVNEPEIPLEPVSGWWTGFTNDEDPVVIWRPYVQKPGEQEARGPFYALSPQSLRLLLREFETALARIEAADSSDLQTVENLQGQSRRQE